MKGLIAVFAILLGAISAVPISRQLGGLSSDVHVRTINGTQMCQLDGQLYQTDEDLPTEDPCEYCTCQPPGFACQVVKCERKPECRALQRSGLCCPEYICDCEFNGKIYQNGERITDNENKCEDCYCVTGEVVCSVIQCAAPPENCEVIPGVNRCCPTYQCPDNVPDHEKESTKMTSLMDESTNVETSKITEIIVTESPQDLVESSDVHFDKEETGTEKSQVDLDGNENEYWLSQLAGESSSDDLKVKDISETNHTKPDLPPSEENETTVEEEFIYDANFSSMTEQPEIVDAVDSVRINVEEGTEAPTEERNELLSFNVGTERNAEEPDMTTSAPEAPSEEADMITMIGLELSDAIKSESEDAEVTDAVTEVIETRIQNTDIIEVTERNAEDLDISTDKTGNELFNEDEVIKSIEEHHETIPARNEETTPASELQSFDEKLLEVTVRSTEEEVGMPTSNPEDVPEDVHKTAKIKLNFNDILQSQDENYATVSSVIEDTEMDELNELETFSSGDTELFGSTERSIEEINMTSIQLVQDPVDAKDDITESFEYTTVDTETRIGDGPIPSEFQLEGVGAIERNAEEESISTVVNKIVKTEVIEKEFLKPQNEIFELSPSALESFDGEAEEFKETEISADVRMTTLQPELKLADAVTDVIDRREENLSNLESLEATERTAGEELSTSNPSVREEDIVVKLAKIDAGNQEQFNFQPSNEDMTTEIIESRIHNKNDINITTEFFEPRTESFLELGGEILEFGIKDVREEAESSTTPESYLYESGEVNEVNKAANIDALQVTSLDSTVIKSDAVAYERNNSKTFDDERITVNEKQNGEDGSSLAKPAKEEQGGNKADDKLEYWMNMGTKTEQPIQGNQLVEKDDAESTTIKEEVNYLMKDNELKSVQNSVTKLERDVEAGTTEPAETEVRNDPPVKVVTEVKKKTATEFTTLSPKKQRTHLHEHLSKKFGLRPLTRRTFSNDIEKRRITRLRDRKMIVSMNRQNLFH